MDGGFASIAPAVRAVLLEQHGVGQNNALSPAPSQSAQQLAKKLGWDRTYATRSRSNAARLGIKALDIFADNNRYWVAFRVDARECSGHAEGSNVVREQPVDVMETAEGAVAELVTRAGDQWRLRLGTTQSVPVTAEYLLELMLQLRELRSRGIL